MAAFSAALVAAAAQRLAGHLVATPLIGTPWLGVGAVHADVRWKPEVLQPGGSALFRGYQHFLLRQLGRCAGLVWHGPAAQLLAAALAAHQHRLTLQAFCEEPIADGLRLLLPPEVTVHAKGGAVAAAAMAQKLGHVLLAPGHPEVLIGIATIGSDLARDLPQSCQRVYADAALVDAIAAGLAAAGRPLPVTFAEAAVLPGLASALWLGHGIHAGDAALRVLSAALAEPAGSCTGAVLG